MAWVRNIECKNDKGRLQPPRVTAFVKVFNVENGALVIQIDTYGSEDRDNPGKQSQTLQFGKESAKQLFDILKQTYNF